MQPIPQAGFVLAKQKKESEVVNLGFELPSNMDNDRNAALAEVIAVGGEIKDWPTPVCKAGDIITHAPFADIKLRVGAEEWIFIEFKHVMATFKEGKTNG